MEQLDVVRAEGCTQVQGFLLGRPGPAYLVPTLLGGFDVSKLTRRTSDAAVA